MLVRGQRDSDSSGRAFARYSAASAGLLGGGVPVASIHAWRASARSRDHASQRLGMGVQVEGDAAQLHCRGGRQAVPL